MDGTEPESYFDIIAREPVRGGHNTTTKEKLHVAVTGAGVDRELTVFLKRTSLTEITALRAANRLSNASAVPRLLRSGRDSRGHWIAIPFYPGQPPLTETAIPENVAESLAAMHAHYLSSEVPEPIPTVDASWVPAVCTLPRLQQLASTRPALRPILDRGHSWSDYPALLDAFASQPRTLLHWRRAPQ